MFWHLGFECLYLRSTSQGIDWFITVSGSCCTSSHCGGCFIVLIFGIICSCGTCLSPISGSNILCRQSFRIIHRGPCPRTLSYPGTTRCSRNSLLPRGRGGAKLSIGTRGRNIQQCQGNIINVQVGSIGGKIIHECGSGFGGEDECVFLVIVDIVILVIIIRKCVLDGSILGQYRSCYGFGCLFFTFFLHCHLLSYRRRRSSCSHW
mmetsp:Transcript_17377/g.31466  ORF Transcript_17377/g.31466 Transcript_17377/m.31466 type:complete len:206 (+) Transcript_17377:2116-2733(+)